VKNKDLILEIVDNLDINETMYKNAEEKYKNIAKYLESKGLDVEIYPQGSFRQGTVVRPYRKGKDRNYDLDFICKCFYDKNKYTPVEFKNIIGDILKENEIYRSRLKEYDRCWTIEYADIQDNIGFNIDIVPALQANEEFKKELFKYNIESDIANEFIIIPDSDGKEGSWISANPEGFALWFESINNQEYIDYRNKIKKEIFKESRHIFASIEEIPDYRIKTPLQRTIQILKRHRDIYYDRSNLNNEKPISAIITTLVSYLVAESHETLDLSNLLNMMYENTRGMEFILKDDNSMLKSVFAEKIKRSGNNRWELLNPVNPKDNLTDSWTDKTAKEFIKWISELEKDLTRGESSNNELRSVFGISTDNLDDKYRDIHPIQPWRCNNDG